MNKLVTAFSATLSTNEMSAKYVVLNGENNAGSDNNVISNYSKENEVEKECENNFTELFRNQYY